MTLRLCLLAVVPVEWNDKQTGEPVKKFKHVFISENKNVHVAWSDHDKLAQYATGQDDFDPTRAREYEVQADEWQGKLRYRVLLPQ